MPHTLIYKSLTIHSLSTLLKVVRATVADAPKPLASFAIVARATAAEWRRSEDAEKGIMYRLKTRMAGVPIFSNWDIWKASY
jgi:hypothetical protein